MSADKENKKASKPKKVKNGKTNALTREQKIARTMANNKARMLEALHKHGGNVTKAAKAADINRETHYRYFNDDPVYAAAVDEVYDSICDEAEDTLIHLMRNSNDRVRLDASKEILKARGKGRGYGVERRDQKHEGELALGGVQLQLFLPDNGKAAKLDK